MTASPADRRTSAGTRLFFSCLGLLLGATFPLPLAAAELVPAYQASLTDGSLAPSMDSLGVGALQSGFSLASSNPTFSFSSEGVTIGLTRPTDPTLVGPVGAGLFATPVSFGQGSIFALQATFVAPIGPHNVGDVWAAAVGARTGDQDDLAAETRLAATFQVRGGAARLNVPGAAVPVNQPNIAQPIYDSIFDAINPQPFTLYLLVDRTTGGGTATLTVGSFVTSVNFLMADFRASSGPPITAVGPSLAINNPAGQSATVTVRDFRILSAVPEPNSWAMILLGFSAMALLLRDRARKVTPVDLRLHCARLGRLGSSRFRRGAARSGGTRPSASLVMPHVVEPVGEIVSPSRHWLGPLGPNQAERFRGWLAAQQRG